MGRKVVRRLRRSEMMASRKPGVSMADMSRRKSRSLAIAFGLASLCSALTAGVGSPYWYWIIPAGLFAAGVTHSGSVRWLRHNFHARGGRPYTDHEPGWVRALRAVSASSGVFAAGWISGGTQSLFLVVASCVFAFPAAIFVIYAELVSPQPVPKHQT